MSVQLEWTYSPETYLEEPILIEFEGGRLKIKDGVALATINPEIFHADDSVREKLTKKIENRLHAVQIITHNDFKLSKPSHTDILEDGRKNCFLEVDSCEIAISVESVDIVVKDKDGNVLSDSKRERLNKQRKFAVLFDKHRANDVTLDQMLKSYQQSVRDPQNELVYLYEIRDALSKRLGSKSKAISALGITYVEWDIIGKIANTMPLKQGRHRGQAAGSLRDAESEELKMARKSALHMIDKYVEFLEASKSN